MADRVMRHDRDGLCTLTLNRPEKLNALDTHSFRELSAHIDELERQTDRIGCVVLRGAGRAFCAGMDLGVVGREAEPPGFKPDIVDRLARLPQPLIGAVQGYRGLIRELIGELKKELKVKRLPVVATGGYAELIAAKLPEIDAVEPNLTLEGLRLVWMEHQKSAK